MLYSNYFKGYNTTYVATNEDLASILRQHTADHLFVLSTGTYCIPILLSIIK